MTISAGQFYTVVRINSEYYIAPHHIAQEDSEVQGANEILRAQTDYTFEVETDPLQALTDQYNTTYERVIDSLFKAHFVAQMPPYIPK